MQSAAHQTSPQTAKALTPQELSVEAGRAEARREFDLAISLRSAAFDGYRAMPSLGESGKLKDLMAASIEAEKLGGLYFQQRKATLAAEALKVAYEIHAQLTPVTDERHLRLLDQRAAYELLNGDRDLPVLLLNELLALRLSSGIGSSVDRVRLYFMLGVCHAARKDDAAFNESLSAGFMELSRVHSDDERRLAVNKLSTLSKALLSHRRLKAAEIVIESELLIIRQLGAVADGALPDLFQRLSQVQLLQGKHDAAIASAEKSLSLLKARYVGEHPDIVQARRALAHQSILAKRPLRAEALTAENIKALEAVKDCPPEVIAHEYLEAASFCLSNCKFSEAAALYEKAKTIAPAEDPELTIDLTRFNASLASLEGKNDEARVLIDRCVELGRRVFKSASEYDQLATLLTRQGISLVSASEFEQAETVFNEAEELLRDAAIDTERRQSCDAHLLNARGDLAGALGRNEEQGRFYLDALRKIQQVPYLRETSSVVPYIIDLASWEIENHATAEALTRLEAARSILNQSGRATHMMMVGILTHMAQAHEQEGNEQQVAELKAEVQSVFTDLQFMNDGKWLKGDDFSGLWD